MGESWKDKTVSLGNVEKEEFDSRLAHVTVSENRISVHFKDVEDWKRIKREIGEETILKEVPWEEVEGLDRDVEHLYFPHVDVETSEGAKRIYFYEDETETLESCFNAIKRFWNVYRERGPRPRDTYSYEGKEEGERKGGEDSGRSGGGRREEEVEIEDEDRGEEDEEDDESLREQAEELVEEFMEG